MEWWARLNRVLALDQEEASVPEEIRSLVATRSEARLAKDWRRSDELREELKALGWEVRDTKGEQKISPRTQTPA